MANLQKFRAHVALNTTAAGNYNQLDGSSGGLGGSAGDTIAAGSSADVANTNVIGIFREIASTPLKLELIGGATNINCCSHSHFYTITIYITYTYLVFKMS